MKRRNEKLSFLRTLSGQFPIIGLQEIHARNRTEAAVYFFDHLDMHVFFHESSDGSINQAILVNKTWYATHRTSLRHISIVSGAMHGIQWITESGQPCLFLNMYLDATSDVSIKLSQLRARGRGVICRLRLLFLGVGIEITYVTHTRECIARRGIGADDRIINSTKHLMIFAQPSTTVVSLISQISPWYEKITIMSCVRCWTSCLQTLICSRSPFIFLFLIGFQLRNLSREIIRQLL